MQIEISKIKPSPFQPRLEFDLEDLKGSIIKDGILVPLTVRKVNENHYELIDGERRLKLAKELGYKAVPCEVVKANDEEADDWIWELNENRKPYQPKERALRYKRFRERGITLEVIARKHNKTSEHIRSYLGVFKLPLKYQELVWDKQIGIGIIQEVLPFLSGKISSTGNQITQILDRTITDEHFGLMEVRKSLRPYLKERQEKVIETAEEIIKIIEPEIKVETPEDYEKAAEAFKREAKKKREESMSPEEKAELERKKERKTKEQKIKVEEARQKRQEIISREAKKLKKEELIKDKKFVAEIQREVRHKETKILEEELGKIGGKVEKPSKPEMVLRLEVQRWINEITVFTTKVNEFDWESLTQLEAKKVLTTYLILRESLEININKSIQIGDKSG